MLMRCGILGGPMAMTGATLGGMAMLASVGPFLAGLGVGAALVGGAFVARRQMEKRTGWRDASGPQDEPPLPGDLPMPAPTAL